MSEHGILSGVKTLVVTVSDRCAAGTQEDISGPAAKQILEAAGAVCEMRCVPDEQPQIVSLLRDALPKFPLIVTTGGTGLAPRDRTPEATLEVCDRLVPGLPELMRRVGYEEKPFAALGRGVCGVAGSTLILNLPGSPRGTATSLRTVLGLLPHALHLIHGANPHE